MAPVTVRNKNPGAMWPGRASRKFGSGAFEQLTDGRKNKAATFATSINGAAAQMYLLATSHHYKGKTIAEAINTWSGGNHVNAYLKLIEDKTDFLRGDYIDATLLGNRDQLTSLCRAMAHHETGYPYPMTDGEWAKAFDLYQTTMDGGRPSVAVERSGPMTAALELAISHIGEREIAGPEDNPFIVECFADVGRPEIQDDETAWCAAFAGAMLKRAGYAYLHKELGARRHLDYGVPIDEPEVGALAIMWRVAPSSWQGHVGFVESWTANEIVLISGNEGNSVSRSSYARGPGTKILGYRRPLPAKAPVGEVLASKSVRLKTVSAVGVLGMVFAEVYDTVAAVVLEGLSFVSSLWSDAPAIATGVASQVAAGKSLFSSLSLPWPAYVAAAIGVAALLVNLHDTWQRKRNRQDSETSAGGAG